MVRCFKYLNDRGLSGFYMSPGHEHPHRLENQNHGALHMLRYMTHSSSSLSLIRWVYWQPKRPIYLRSNHPDIAKTAWRQNNVAYSTMFAHT